VRKIEFEKNLKISDKLIGLAGRCVIASIILFLGVQLVEAHTGVNLVDVALGNGSVTQGLLDSIGVGGGQNKKHHQPAKSKQDKPALAQGCQGRHHGPGCLAAGYVKSGRIYIPASDDLKDYRMATGALPAPSTRVTPDGYTSHYYPVNRPVWLSLVRMANSLNSRMCHKVKGKHHKKHRVCKMTLGAVEVSCLESCHNYHTDSGNLSDHTVGEAVDVGMVRWRGTWHIIDYSWQHTFMGKMLLKHMTAACLNTGAHQAISLWDFGYGDRSFSLPDHDDHLHCGGYSWK